MADFCECSNEKFVHKLQVMSGLAEDLLVSDERLCPVELFFAVVFRPPMYFAMYFTHHSHTVTYTHIHSHTLTCTHIHSHTLTYTHIHSHKLTYTHIHSHTVTYTHIHSHTLTYTGSLLLNYNKKKSYIAHRKSESRKKMQ